ncbi:CDP-diacylglycerol--glycerol-3-phosphate 3-phosphatidyltransferase [bacterium]|nr:CDP-diacylglycerol--glycerol-3-phosphate 3-phosphatidyltransferase [bacterium]
MTIPNIITLIRIFLVPFAILSLFIDFPYHLHIALVIYLVASSSDFLDGFMARKLKQETNVGILLDPMADKLLHILLLVSLVVLNVFPLWIVMLLIARELVVDTFLNFASSHGGLTKSIFATKFKSFFIDVAVILGELGLIVNEGYYVFGITYNSFKTIAYILLIIAFFLGVVGGKTYFTVIKKDF